MVQKPDHLNTKQMDAIMFSYVLAQYSNVSGFQVVGIQIPTVNAQRISDFENANFIKIRLQKQGRGGGSENFKGHKFISDKKESQLIF